MKKTQIQSIQCVIKELKKLQEKYLNDRDRYESAEFAAKKQKDFWQGQADDLQAQIEGHEKTLPKELELT